MFRDVEVDNSPSVMRQHDEHEQHFECRRGHDKEVDSDELVQVLIEKCPPSRGGRSAATEFVLLHGRFRDIDPQLMKFCHYTG